jgi:hypothetical protein
VLFQQCFYLNPIAKHALKFQMMLKEVKRSACLLPDKNIYSDDNLLDKVVYSAKVVQKDLRITSTNYFHL